MSDYRYVGTIDSDPGMVIASFNLLMYLPVSIELLKIMLNGSEIIDFIKCKILIGIPLGPILLLILSSEIRTVKEGSKGVT